MEHGIIFAEMKARPGKAREAQREWLHCLRRSEVRAYVWKPRGWRYIVETLMGQEPDNGYPRREEERAPKEWRHWER